MSRWVYLHIIAVAIALITANVECITRCLGGVSPAKTPPCHGGATGQENAPSGCKSPVLVAATDATKFAPVLHHLTSALPDDRTLTFAPTIDETTGAITASPPAFLNSRFSVILRL
ncbi:MAG TPA: hypothetical protein VEX68_01585 [Bryobacteraceae bacterium]|nr:hypothetical protein [Bryobacteraceae bacterium]